MMRKIGYIIYICLAFLLSSCTSQSKEEKELIDYAKKMNYNIKSNKVQNADPAILFCYSNYLWGQDRKEEAVFWYYTAQYRYRFLSSCSEKLKAGSFSEEEGKKIYIDSGTLAGNLDYLHLIGGVYKIELYETIQAVLGKKINGWAYGNLQQMKNNIDKMLEYQEKSPFNPNALTPKPVLISLDKQAEKIKKIKDSYIEQKKEIDINADKIRKIRSENGLENRE